MLKLTIVTLAFALAGTASAAGWRALTVDGSSEEAFAQSLAVFKKELSPARAAVFGEALKDIWLQGTKSAEAEQREYTAADYYEQLDGLSYKQIVNWTDPTGKTARVRYQRASLSARRSPGVTMASINPPWPQRPPPIGPTGEQRRGGNYTHPLQ
jgi:hypothetical protein